MASDHAGFEMKNYIFHVLFQYASHVVDLGPYDQYNAVDYPLYASKLAHNIYRELYGTSYGCNGCNCMELPCDEVVLDSHSGGANVAGVLICGSGIGMSIAANRFPFIRAALCTTTKYAKFARLHNDANVLVLGSRVMTVKRTMAIVRTFFETDFSQDDRHKRRIAQVSEMPV